MPQLGSIRVPLLPALLPAPPQERKRNQTAAVPAQVDKDTDDPAPVLRKFVAIRDKSGAGGVVSDVGSLRTMDAGISLPGGQQDSRDALVQLYDLLLRDLQNLSLYYFKRLDTAKVCWRP